MKWPLERRNFEKYHCLLFWASHLQDHLCTLVVFALPIYLHVLPDKCMFFQYLPCCHKHMNLINKFYSGLFLNMFRVHSNAHVIAIQLLRMMLYIIIAKTCYSLMLGLYFRIRIDFAVRHYFRMNRTFNHPLRCLLLLL